MIKKLVVNADDFGFTRDVNDGIVEAHRSGILTATTLMANGEAFDHAITLVGENPALDIGCHLVLVGGASLVDGRSYPLTVGQMMREVMAGRLNPVAEFRPQIEKILAAGIFISHLDTHKHTHLFPPVLEAMAKLSQEFQIPWVRRPFDFPSQGGTVPFSRRVVSRSLRVLRPYCTKIFQRHGCRFTDHFAGFELTGFFHATDLVRLIERLPAGSTELMCHPGYAKNDLQGVRTRLKESREQELRALIDPSLREALSRSGVQLLRYRDL